MEGGSGEMHSEDDKGVTEKNPKRIVKTRAQVEALEKLFDEDKNPSMATKKQLADSIGLTEKQVAGWFCHRRLKDKKESKSMNGENHTIGRQDRSSGVVQDRASGHRQDSCGSTKVGEDKNFDTREVESGRLAQQEYYSAGEQIYERSGNYAGNYKRRDNASSGSSSSSEDGSNGHIGGPLNPKTARYPVPRFPLDGKGLKSRPGPSGYLKVKGQPVENPAITAVKKQLGKNYRHDGPPLGVDFDPLPPGAFESLMQDRVDEAYCDEEEDDLPATPDVPTMHQHPKLNKGYEYNYGVGPHNPNMDGTRFEASKRSEVPYNFVHPKSSEATRSSHNGMYYPRRSSSVEFPEGPTRDVRISESRDDYGMWPRQGVDRVGAVSRHRDPQIHGEKVRAEPKPYSKYNYPGNTIYQGENVDKSSYYAMKGYHNSVEMGPPRQIVKEGKAFAERRMIMNEDQVQVLLRTDSNAPKRMRKDYPHNYQYVKRDSAVMRPRADVPTSFSEDDESAETGSSVD